MIKNLNSHQFQVLINPNPRSKKVAQHIKDLLTNKGWTISKTNPKFLFIVGGDGTLVRSLRCYYNRQINIICINTGSIGFYAHFHDDNFNDFISIITNSKNYINPSLLEIKVNNKHFNSINEVVVQSLNTIAMDIKINHIFYEHYKGSGVMISTRGGSTAWAKSAGGAIIMPNVNAFELVELSPTLHTKSITVNASLIIDGHDQVVLNNFASSQRCDLIIDGMRVMAIKPHDCISIRQIKSKFKLCLNHNLQEYITKLQKTFIKN